MNECEQMFREIEKPLHKKSVDSEDETVVIDKDGDLDFLLEANLDESPEKDGEKMESDEDLNKMLEKDYKKKAVRENVHRQN